MSEQERAAFRHAIEQNPFEATNHLVYSDWLREHDALPDHADFRKALGEWLQGRPRINVYGGTYSHTIRRDELPVWASGPHEPESIPMTPQTTRRHVLDAESRGDVFESPNGNNLMFAGWQHLENALWGAFERHRRATKLSRLTARRYMRP